MIVYADFYYPGPYTNMPDDDEETRSAARYDALSEKKLKKSGFKFAHAYSWPDGSLYKYINIGNFSIENAEKMITKVLKGTGLGVSLSPVISNGSLEEAKVRLKNRYPRKR